jgi:hypothetical protein
MRLTVTLEDKYSLSISSVNMRIYIAALKSEVNLQ